MSTTDTFTASGTWTCPAGVTSVAVECWAAGESGEQNDPGPNNGGRGGGYAKKNTYSVTPGNNYTVTVGAGGHGNHVAGGDSWFSTTGTVLAKGGGSASTAVGDTINTGGSPQDAAEFEGETGGGGGAGSSGNGGNGSGRTGGAGGSGSGGAGGNAQSGYVGLAGATLGGGGGGGADGFISGDGARGEVRITYTAAVSSPPRILGSNQAVKRTSYY